MKFLDDELEAERVLVAPFTGAWIEITRIRTMPSIIWRRSLHGSVD